jgi:hypothetical protein
MDSPTWLEAVSAIGSLLGGLGLFAAASGLIYLARQTRASVRVGQMFFYMALRRVLTGRATPQDIGLMDAINDTLQVLGLVEPTKTFYKG